jgi:hypothetical protein
VTPSESDPLEDLALLAAAPLVTGRYQAWRPDSGVPIRSTVGYPKFWRHGAMPHAKEITPYGVFGKGLDPDTARTAYRKRLDHHAETIVASLADLARRHPGKALCILCFENVHAGEACHRRWFAEWMEERYGIAVAELPASQPQLPL